MDNGLFQKLCKELVAEYMNQSIANGKKSYSKKDVYVVWLAKTLQNNKALLSSNCKDGMYYEITYNGDKQCFYFDAYQKKQNKCFTVEDFSGNIRF